MRRLPPRKTVPPRPARARLAAALLAGALASVAAGPLASPATAASFDCATNRAPDEAAICKDCELAQLDVKLAALYGVVTRLVGMGQRGTIQDDQRAWLVQRAACGGNTGCIASAYKTRIDQIQGLLSDIYSRGPF